jgi:hypothetical protein
MIRSGRGHLPSRVVKYDAPSHRLWILGQRCHHGATGTVVAAASFIGLIVEPPVRGLSVAGIAIGSALMAHDWRDRGVWFERGPGSKR